MYNAYQYGCLTKVCGEIEHNISTLYLLKRTNEHRNVVVEGKQQKCGGGGGGGKTIEMW